MDLFQWDRNPWGQEILVRISWNLLWASVVAGVLFTLGHLIFRRYWLPGIAAAQAASGEAAEAPANVPDKITRHSGAARLFHGVMALAMFALLITGFFPVIGLQFPWVTIHWVAGLALTASIVFHIVHAGMRGNLEAVAIGRRDLEDLWRRFRRGLGKPTTPPELPAKYPLPNKLYHHITVVASGLAIGTGALMMVRVQTPLWTRNPYLLSEGTWGIVYVIHGLSAVGLVTLVMAHVYFAVLPEKRWMTRAMIYGWIRRDEYLAHHDPRRWPVVAEEPIPDTDTD